LIFVIVCLIIGVCEVIHGFRTKTVWRRLQGLILMTISIMTAAFVDYKAADQSIIRAVLLILGGILVIVIIVLQLYWWKVFQKLCGSGDVKNEIQDQLQQDNEETLKQKQILTSQSPNSIQQEEV